MICKRLFWGSKEEVLYTNLRKGIVMRLSDAFAFPSPPLNLPPQSDGAGAVSVRPELRDLLTYHWPTEVNESETESKRDSE